MYAGRISSRGQGRWWLTAVAMLSLVALLVSAVVAPVAANEFGFHIQQTDRGSSGRRLVPSPKPYVFDRSYEFLGLNGPQDIFYQREGDYLWVADTGNHRIVQLTDGRRVRTRDPDHRRRRRSARSIAWEAGVSTLLRASS